MTGKEETEKGWEREGNGTIMKGEREIMREDEGEVE